MLATTASTLPVLVLIRDQWLGVSRVHGSSMEPLLKDGDVLLVRKADAGSLLRGLGVLGSGDSDHYEQERQRVVRYELLQGGLQQHHSGLLYGRPPTVVAGDLVVYQNPGQMARQEFLVKRAVGVGGQWIRLLPPAEDDERSTSRQQRQVRSPYEYRMQALPPYTVYVEGSNHKTSTDDSRQHGPISKNLVVGVAEYRLWPPRRWGRLRSSSVNDDDDDAEEQPPRAVWY